VTRIALATLAVALGHALAFGAYLGLINTPDSNALMLVLSALLLAGGALIAVLTSVLAARALQAGPRAWLGWPAALRLLPSAFLVIAVAGLFCWLAGGVEAWWTSRAGEVDATAIAVGGVTDTAWLHGLVRWTVALVQWVLVPCWIAAGLAWAVAYGVRDVLSGKWLVAGLSLRTLLTALVAVVVLVWLPWRTVYWRPAAITSPQVEMAFTAVKLALLYLAANLAWVAVLDAAARSTRGILRTPLK
jgi:hypothetical protein